ncbi:MAG: hypothetical protein IT539_02800 [Bradyrhizobiaceae bacterium]|nr:hypothetical protein [Bradyrhizobiaceae bacterium]
MFVVRTRHLMLLAVIALSAAGCIVEIEHSIIEKPEAPDPRLAGVWALEADGGAQVLVLYRKEGEENQLQATFVIAAKDEVPSASRAAVRFAAIGSRPYFEADWRAGEWLPFDVPVRRAFGTYEISGAADAETLKICFGDPESFEAPLKSGALAGFSGRGETYQRRVVISSDGAALRAYLAKNHFKCTVSATYRRVTGPAQSK